MNIERPRPYSSETWHMKSFDSPGPIVLFIISVTINNVFARMFGTDNGGEETRMRVYERDDRNGDSNGS